MTDGKLIQSDQCTIQWMCNFAGNTLYSFGFNFYGQLGNGGTANRVIAALVIRGGWNCDGGTADGSSFKQNCDFGLHSF
jgi:hypothetical protein